MVQLALDTLEKIKICHINQECLMKSSQATLVHLHFTLDYYQAGNDL